MSEFDRNLLKFEPTMVALEESTPASYYFTMFNIDTQRTVYSNFFPSINNLLIELISSDYNQTDTYGPERGSTIHSTPGAYDVQGNFIDPGVYRLSVAVTAVDGQPLEQISAEQFELEVIE